MRIPSTEVQNNFGKYLKYIEANEEIIVTKNGKDIAKMTPCLESNSDRTKEYASEYRTKHGWVTHEEFLQLIESSEQRFELIDGVIYNLASPSFQHQYVVHQLHGALYNWFKGKPCSPLTSPFDVTFVKDENNISIVQPDILVICDKEAIDKEGKYQGIPTLIIEVLSPSTRSKDMLTKLDLYKQGGVHEYWIVDPMNEQLSVYELKNNDITNHKSYVRIAQEDIQSFYFEGLTIAINDIFF